MNNPAKSLLQLNGHDIEVWRKKVRYLRLTLYPNGIIRLSAPEQASVREIQDFLESKAAWLQKNLASLKETRSRPKPPPQPKNTLFLWGVEYKLALLRQPGPSRTERRGNSIELFMPDPSLSPDFYIAQLYAWETADKAAPLLDIWTRKMKLGSVQCSIRAMKSRWGSCTANAGRIRLNSWLAAYLPECLEYVLVHELCHFFETNHGPAFYKLLGSHLPDWESRRQILKQGNRGR